MARSVLTINGGSSSIKFALFAMEASSRRLLAGKVERIGFADAVIVGMDHDGQALPCRSIGVASQAQAVGQLVDWLREHIDLAAVAAVGHRIVHGGMLYSEATLIDQLMLDELRRLGPIDPLHLPAEIKLIEAFQQKLPGIPQVGCFDTAFHRDLPRLASLLPLPRHYYEAKGVRRYGFHGLSYAYLLEELARHDANAARGRMILAHLGMGASMAAVLNGKCIDTTMAFTPTAGLVMGTRSGDLDPGLLVYLMRNERMTVDQLDELVNQRSGLLGVSETSSDMRDLLARRAKDPRAADAVALFCYQAKKWIGALTAALNGLDTLVFTGGIGENAPEVRVCICDGLGFLGAELDAVANAISAPIVSTAASRVTVRVMPTDEELMIARSVSSILTAGGLPEEKEHHG